MTAIVGIVHNGRVLLGGDSAGSNDYFVAVRADPKVFTTGPYVMGFTYSFRLGDLLRYNLTPPRPDGNLDRFMRTAFIDAVRTCLKAGGFSRKDNEQESGGTFLVGVVGHLFRVDCDYQVGETLCGYDAVGSGEGIACGSLHTSAALDMAPEARVTAALSAAAEHSAGVRPPFNLVWEPRSTQRRNTP